MHRVTRILMAAEERLDQIIDSVYCPISGVVMTAPVLMSDSVTYERANIEDWIRTHGNLSPISKQPFTGNPIINGVVQNRIESSSATLSPQPVLRIRLRVSMQWLVQSKCPLETFDSAYQDFSMRRFTTQDPWPLSANPDACVDLTWAHCARLRFMVYKEFANARGEGPNASEWTKNLAARWFVDSMKKPSLRSKTDQLIRALEMSNLPTRSISDEWKDFWGDSLPQTQPSPQTAYDRSRQQEDGMYMPQRSDDYGAWQQRTHVYTPPRHYPDTSTPQRSSPPSTQWDAYAGYGTAGFQGWGRDR
jgi:hypothetical protein